MSESLVELVRRGYESWNRGDRQWVLDHMSRNVEWITPPEDPEPGTYRGYEGLERFWAQWRAAVGQLRLEPQEIIDAGDRVLVVALRSGRGEHSGLDISDHVLQVFSQVLNLMDQEPLAGHLWIVEEHQVRIRGEKEGA